MIALAALLTASLLAQDTQLRSPAEQAAREAVLPSNLYAATELRVYELAELTGHRQLQELLSGFASSTEPETVEDALERLARLDQARANAESTTEYLCSSIRDLIEPSLVEGLHRLRHLERGRLALVGTQAQHAWLEGFLRAADEFEGVIMLEAKIFKFDSFDLPGLAERGSGQVLSLPETRALLADLGAAGIEQVSAPTITTFPFQRAHLSVLNETAYIRDYELKILPDLQREIADPLIDNVQNGLILELRGVPLAGEEIGVFVDLELSELELPIPSAEIVIGAGRHEVTVQLPQVTRIRVEGHFDVRSGETLMLATADPTGKTEVLVLLQVTRVSTEDIAPPESR